MNQIIKPTLCLAVGIAIGICGTVAASQTQPQAPMSRVASSPRIASTRVGGGPDSANIWFIRDTKTGDCWIYTQRPDGIGTGIAVAQPAACR